MQALGQELFEILEQAQPEFAGKLTGMLLELGEAEVRSCLESQEHLAMRLDEAMVILDESGQVNTAKPKEEARVDPEDGKLRTFYELKRLCGAQYTAQEVEDYWATMNRPDENDAEGPSSTPTATQAAMPKKPAAATVPAASPAEDHSAAELLPGLSAWLEALKLEKYSDAMNKWIEDQGPCCLEEVLECCEELADDLGLKPIEKKRLLKDGADAVEPAKEKAAEDVKRKQKAAALPAKPAATASASGAKAKAKPKAKGPSAEELRKERAAAEEEDRKRRSAQETEAAERLRREQDAEQSQMADEKQHMLEEMAREQEELERERKEFEEMSKPQPRAKASAKSVPSAPSVRVAPSVRAAPKAQAAAAVSHEEAEWNRQNDQDEREYKRKQEVRRKAKEAEEAEQLAEEKRQEKARQAEERQQRAASELAAKVAGEAANTAESNDFPTLGGDWQASTGKKGKKKR